MQRLSPDDAEIFPKGDAPERLGDTLWRIPLPLPFALRSVNVYLIGDGAGHWTLFDAGLGLRGDREALRAGLALASVPMEALDALVLTHAHPDHIGLAGLIHTASGAPIYMLAQEDDEMYRVWGDRTAEALLTTARSFAAHGLPLTERDADPRITSSDRRDGDGVQKANLFPKGFALPPRDAIRPLTDGETLTLGRWNYQVIWTPGHSDHHMCLLRSDGVFLAGDHILPGITPNIGLYPESRPDPLGDYYASLQRVRDLPVRLVAPGHRLPFAALAERVDALRDHHIERSATIRELVDSRPEGMSANSVASDLFGLRLRSIDDRRFALAETLAHLEHLRAHGDVRRELSDGLYTYFAAHRSVVARRA